MENPEPQPSAPAILMTGVAAGSLRDPAITVLVDVNWKVSSGNFWVLAGLQGTGKRDFLMMTAGLMAPLSGRYSLFGDEMPIFEEARLPQRLRLGLAFESGQLFNQLTVRENLALPLRYHQDLSKAEVAPAVQSMLETTELAPWADSTPGALGRNWQKRVGLARALMLKPEVLLIDNPLGGLDLRHISWWLRALERLSQRRNFVRDEPLTLVVTTGDLRPWMGRARQFAILKDRRMTVLGSRAELEAASAELVGDLHPPELSNG
jgi:ABC-type transporter Mla maintaining outer membrane lipid asymmetry ATPase subunit MlaF